jgi:hypothetical protein
MDLSLIHRAIPGQVSLGVRAPIKPDVSTWDELLFDLVLCCAQKLAGVKNLLFRRDVVRLAGKQVNGTRDVPEVQPATKTDEGALCEAVFFEQLDDRLKIPAARQVDRILVPAREGLFLPQILGIVDVFVKIDVALDVVLLGIHVLPAAQHRLTAH